MAGQSCQAGPLSRRIVVHTQNELFILKDSGCFDDSSDTFGYISNHFSLDEPAN